MVICQKYQMVTPGKCLTGSKLLVYNTNTYVIFAIFCSKGAALARTIIAHQINSYDKSVIYHLHWFHGKQHPSRPCWRSFTAFFII